MYRLGARSYAGATPVLRRCYAGAPVQNHGRRNHVIFTVLVSSAETKPISAQNFNMFSSIFSTLVAAFRLDKGIASQNG